MHGWNIHSMNGGRCRMKSLLQSVAEAGLTEVCVAERTGQDLIEYGMVVAFIAFAATAGMNALATDINGAFTTLGTDLTGAIA
jgi:Flp pilus assembly pilin Flp